MKVSRKPTVNETAAFSGQWRPPVRTIRAAVIEATKAGEPNRWTHYLGPEGYGFRQRMFSHSDWNVMRHVASIRRRERSATMRALGMKLRATMADETAPRQYCDGRLYTSTSGSVVAFFERAPHRGVIE